MCSIIGKSHGKKLGLRRPSEMQTYIYLYLNGKTALAHQRKTSAGFFCAGENVNPQSVPCLPVMPRAAPTARKCQII